MSIPLTAFSAEVPSELGEIGDACVGQCGFNLDNPFNIKFN
jgi:hypothetical protein